MFQLTFISWSTLYQPLGENHSPLGFTETLRNTPKEALFVHLCRLSLSKAHSIQKHMLFEGSPQVSLEQFATYLSPILLSNYFWDNEIRDLCTSHLWRWTAVASGGGWWRICLGVYSRGRLCLWVCKCIRVLWFRPQWNTCLSLETPSLSWLLTSPCSWLPGLLEIRLSATQHLYDSVKANRTGSAEQHKPQERPYTEH